MRPLILALVWLAACAPDDTQTPDVVDDVCGPRTCVQMPLIGSGGVGYGVGNAFPGATAPHGFVKLGPHTMGEFGAPEFLHEAGYWYGDDTVRGFAHTHLHGTGSGDYGLIMVMPSTDFDPSNPDPISVRSTFDKASEVAEPGTYAVTLDRGGIQAELTATTRAGAHRYTFARGSTDGWLLLDLSEAIGSRVPSVEVTLDPATHRLHGVLHHEEGMGGTYDLFFEARTKDAWTEALVWNDGVVATPGTSLTGVPGGIALHLPTNGAPIELQVGLSMISEEGALANLDAEMPGWDFDGTRAATAATWDGLLDRVKVEGGTAETRLMLRAAMYHSFLMPSFLGDVDGRWRGHDALVHDAEDFTFVTDLSLWDTYRTLHPLYAILAPDRARDSVMSLHAMAKESGRFPKWPLARGDSGSMVGSGADIVLADAYARGVTDFDAEGAWQIVRAAALDEVRPPGGRGGRDGGEEDYMRLGYVSAAHGGSVSLTTEFATDDAALAVFGRMLGHDADADTLLARSKGYRALFDPLTGFLWPKDGAGNWSNDHDDATYFGDEFVEGNAWQSTWMAAHDIDGLVGLYASRDAFVDQLDAFFANAKVDWELNPPSASIGGVAPRPYYWAGNEPDIHAAYLFAQAGRADLTQRWLNWAMLNLYGPGADGIPGNDDGGAMSSWWVFGAIGFYPLPGSDQFIVGAPLFPKATIAVPGGTFTIEGRGVSKDAIYVQSVTLNGAALTEPTFTMSSLIPGGSLVFEMGEEPGSWGVTK